MKEATFNKADTKDGSADNGDEESGWIQETMADLWKWKLIGPNGYLPRYQIYISMLRILSEKYKS